MKRYIDDFKDIFLFSLSSFTVIGLFLLLLILDVDMLFALGISLFIGGYLFYKQNNTTNARGVGKQRLKRLSPEKEAFYKSKGMSKDEIHFFRETMQTAKIQILKIEKNLETTGKLKAIENRHNTARIMKALFKEITQDPKRLHEVDRFLYVHLPSLTELTDKYVEIDQHEAKTKSTYEILHQSTETIEELCQLIVKDYVSFKSEDLDDMEIEVELAKRTIERDNGNVSSIENDEI